MGSSTPWRARASRGLRALRAALGPTPCSVCGRLVDGVDRPICDACDERLPWWRRADGCPRCGMPVDPGRAESDASWGRVRGGIAACPRCLADGSPLHLCIAATRYAEPIPRLLLAFKNPKGPFGPTPAVWRGIDHLADALADRTNAILATAPDAVVPIPLHARRRGRRGFNQADLIAHRIAGRLGCPFEPAMLERARDTGSQSGLAAAARRANLVGAFAVARLPAPGARLVLVDDVLTTGSTLDAAANALLDGGASEVLALVLAATVATRRSRSSREDGSSASGRRD